MKFHWKVLLWMAAGVVVGLVLQFVTRADAWAGGEFRASEGGLELTRAAKGGPLDRSGLSVGDRVDAFALGAATLRRRGGEGGELAWTRLTDPHSFDAAVASSSVGDVLFLRRAGGGEVLLTLAMDPDSVRARWIAPFDFVAKIFLALLKMLIVPVILTSIVTGVAGVGGMGDLRRLGGKTFLYYISTSLLAILAGQVLVTLVQPGHGAVLGLAPLAEGGVAPDESFLGVLERMVPPNVVAALSDNGKMLQVIFFALLFGAFLTRAAEPHRSRVQDLFESLFQVVMGLAEGVLALLPYGVFALMVRVVAKTGYAVFEPLLLYMAVVVAALAFHALVTLPTLMRVVGRMSPLRWAKAMAPALMTAFSTSSSSMTLPVTLDTVEKRGRVSNRVTSFTLPLGATINMDGTALYECIGVVFLAQYYGSAGHFELTLTSQALVVVMALLASIGAAGIPSAGLVMMLSILAALGLPLEGAALLLAVDRPLDMLRTVVNVWSDTCGAAIVARTEGETGPLEAP